MIHPMPKPHFLSLVDYYYKKNALVNNEEVVSIQVQSTFVFIEGEPKRVVRYFVKLKSTAAFYCDEVLETADLEGWVKENPLGSKEV